MPRVTSAVTRAKRHKKIRKMAKGFGGFRGRTFRGAHEGVMHALKNAYIGRRLKKRDMRKLWITRISAALKQRGLGYSTFMHQMKLQNVGLNRKVLSDIAMSDPATFDKIVAEVSPHND